MAGGYSCQRTIAARTKEARDGHLSRPSSSLAASGAIQSMIFLTLMPMVAAGQRCSSAVVVGRTKR